MKIIVHTSDNPRIIVGKARNMQMIVEYQGSASNSNIIRCTETEFNALSSLDSKTIYAVTDNSDNLLYVYIGYDKLSLESETITKFGWVVNVSSVGYDTLYFFKDQSTANSWLQSPTAANAPLASTTVSNVGNTINLGKPQSGYYTLTTAIAAVPSASRKGGLCITFMVADGVWRTYRYKPATTTGWSTESNWEDTTSEIEEMLEELDDKKADKTGLHHSLGSGTSDGLAGTDVVDAEYTLRCTGDKMSNLGTGAAAIDTVKGNTLVWNQLVKNPNFTEGTGGFDNWGIYDVSSLSVVDGVCTFIGSSGSGQINQTMGDWIGGHKYLTIVWMKLSEQAQCRFSLRSTYKYQKSIPTEWTKVAYIEECDATGSGYFSINIYKSGGGITGYVRSAILFDLTKMFGSGYEPSTVAEFEARYPLSYYAYNAGTLINNSASGIKTIGFNQWDEETERGSINANGELVVYNDALRSKNFCPIIQGNVYNLQANGNNGGNVVIHFYDASKNHVKYAGTGAYDNAYNGGNGTFTPPQGAAFFKLRLTTAYGTTYDHNICINLSWSGYRNGEYEPYEEHTVYFDSDLGASGSLATIKGRKLNAQGEIDDPTAPSAAVFPDGMKSAGSVYDEIKGNVAIKRIGSVDLGTLVFHPYSATNLSIYNELFATVNNAKKGTLNMLCTKYTPSPNAWGQETNNSISIHPGSGNLYIYDTSINASTDIDSQGKVAKLNNVILYYELATPETYLLDNPLPSCYAENKLGTEERLPKDTASAVNAPLKYTVKYPMNIAKNYVSADSISNLLTELATKFGAAMSKTITITPTFNENTQEFDYSVTIT